MRTVVAASIAGTVLAVHSPADAEVSPRAVSSTGAIQHSNSRDGQAVLSAANMRPGDSAGGTVTIANSGNGSGAFTLETSGLTDVPGPGGGRLASALRLSVRDEGSARTVYSGSLDGLSAVALGTWAADESRTYRFDVSLPSSAPAQNSLQASNARIAFRWRSAAADAPPPVTETTPSPAPIPTPAPAPTPTPTPPPPMRDATPPKLKLTAAKKGQKIRRGTVRFTAACDEDCRIVGTSLKGAKVKAPKLLEAGKKATVVVKLSKKDAKKFDKKRKAVIKVKVTATDMSANRAAASVKIAVKR